MVGVLVRVLVRVLVGVFVGTAPHVAEPKPDVPSGQRAVALTL